MDKGPIMPPDIKFKMPKQQQELQQRAARGLKIRQNSMKNITLASGSGLATLSNGKHIRETASCQIAASLEAPSMQKCSNTKTASTNVADAHLHDKPGKPSAAHPSKLNS
jgi:hypothetical protein